MVDIYIREKLAYITGNTGIYKNQEVKNSKRWAKKLLIL